MKEKKRAFKFFSVAEYDKEQEYLQEEHKKGWKLVDVRFPGIYTFVKCEPEDVVYQLDYNPDRESGMGEYIQMFQDCGWEYLFDFVGYSYFRKPVAAMTGEEEIFNDDGSKLDMLDRVFKGRMIPLFIIFGLVICPQLVNNFMRRTEPFALGMCIMLCAVFLLYVGVFAKWGISYRRLKKRLSD